MFQIPLESLSHISDFKLYPELQAVQLVFVVQDVQPEGQPVQLFDVFK